MLGVLCAVLLVLAWEVIPLPAGMGGATGTPRPAARIDAAGRLLPTKFASEAAAAPEAKKEATK